MLLWAVLAGVLHGVPLWLLQSALIAGVWLAGVRSRLATRALVAGLPIGVLLLFPPETDVKFETVWAAIYVMLGLVSRLPREPAEAPGRAPAAASDQPPPSLD